jgi:endo-1,3(4)-beta-glucanase
LIYAEAVVSTLDPARLTGPEGALIRSWVNALVRDFANPVNDVSFPFSRSFDWYHGHSWATGLEPALDGKNEESTSEDAFSLYAVKLWGRVSGDASMEGRANLQLAILKRTLKHYFLMESDNENHPSNFIANKVSGIVSDLDLLLCCSKWKLTITKLYENKLHHTTFFGNNIEFIHGIHMLPISPISAYMRSKKFVNEEWQSFFKGNNFMPKADGWRSVLFGNQALIEPLASFRFFASEKFKSSWIGVGESRAYYLFYSSVLADLW